MPLRVFVAVEVVLERAVVRRGQTGSSRSSHLRVATAKRPAHDVEAFVDHLLFGRTSTGTVPLLEALSIAAGLALSFTRAARGRRPLTASASRTRIA
jgi:hypothetical protein